MKLTCDLCGGSLEMKNGSAVCQGCGLTYSMETLREKMGRPAQTSAPASAPAPDATNTANVNSAQHTNLLNLARLEFNNKNYAKVISTCDQVLASDYSNKDAWQLKIRSSDAKSAIGSYQAYYASQQTEEGRAHAASFGKSHFAAQKLVEIEEQEALLAVFPELANKVANKSIESSISSLNEYISEIRAAQDWEKRNKPSSEHQENEETIKVRGKLADRLRWVDSHIRRIEEYHAFSKLANSEIDANLLAYCDALVTWMDLIQEFKRWDGEFHRRETVSVYTTKYYYHNYKLIPLFYDTSWEYGACDRYKKTIKTVRSALARQSEARAAQRAAEEKKRIADYWREHPEEKQELERSILELKASINELKAKFRESDEVALKNELEKELAALQSQRKTLGVFDFKRKKTMDLEISQKENDLLCANNRCKELEAKMNEKVKEIQCKILAVNDRLNLIGVKPKR